MDVADFTVLPLDAEHLGFEAWERLNQAGNALRLGTLEERTLVDVPVTADEAHQSMPEPWVLLDGQKSEERLGRVAGVLQDRAREGLAFLRLELSVREGQAVQCAVVVQNLVDQGRK